MGSPEPHDPATPPFLPPPARPSWPLALARRGPYGRLARTLTAYYYHCRALTTTPPNASLTAPASTTTAHPPLPLLHRTTQVRGPRRCRIMRRR
ncbi:Hypothetical protein NTJ_11741 [Nesidiocoris tenuis]|uniref:Uncharacterized protein n=1 Tax=Nesidiocoris tenuis TaxID=355587 RepID=A0ABN7B5R6_9HEMI|nr:Hypothetical protein NTJ_11741 [Nesidiocoris tenuis]